MIISKSKLWAALAALVLASTAAAQTSEGWTLQQCLDYALAHNLDVQRNAAAVQTAEIDRTEAKAAWLPSLSGNVSQSLQYRPFQESAAGLVNDGIASSASNKATQSGSYGINAQWTVWDGGRRRLNIQNSDIAISSAQLAQEATAATVQEQVAQLYVQTLYTKEALRVNEQLLAQDSALYARGQEMVAQGQMSRADLAQLAAQVSQGRYDVVSVATQIATLTTQLRQLMHLPATEAFAVATLSADSTSVLPAAIPGLASVYAQALEERPELKSSRLAVEQSELATKLARAGYMPSISLTGGLGDSHMTGTGRTFFDQMKTNFNANVGLSVSIPILDNRQTRSAVERAQVGQLTSQLDLLDAEKDLYATVENYHLTATSSQQRYLAALDNVRSLGESYELVRERYELGVVNVVELLQSRSSLLSAQQSLLEDKYTTLLNLALLQFYGGRPISL